MDVRSFVLALAGLFALMMAIAIFKRSQRETPVDSFFGPLPEDEVERAEASGRERHDPARSGQVTPGAVTPPSTGASEKIYDQTEVGQEGPKQVSGPPPIAGPGATTSDPARDTPLQPSSTGWTNDSGWQADRESGSKPWLPYSVAGGGAVAGLAIAAFLRRRARRQSRATRLRSKARKAAAMASSAAAAAGNRASALHEAIPENLDRKTGAGSGVALVAALATVAAFRRWRHESEARRLAAEAAAQAAAAQKRGLLGLTLGAAWLSRQRDRANGWAVIPDRLPERAPIWAPIVGGLGLTVLGITVVRRLTHRGPYWAGAKVADSAPAREPPATS